MSLHEYRVGMTIAAQDYPFYALIMAAMRQADTHNIERLKTAFPKVWDELKVRYMSPGGALTTAEGEELERQFKQEETVDGRR